MNKKLALIDKEWLTKETGDPFADIGGYVIDYLLSERFSGKDIFELIEFATKLYVNNWGGKLNTFFLNSKITQPAFKGNRKITETLNYFNSILSSNNTGEIGYCRITGRKTQLFPAGRDNSIMSGSGKFVNFHHVFEEGIKLSKEIIIRIFFVPLGSILLAGKILLISSNNRNITQSFVEKNIKTNFLNLGTGINEGVAKSEYNNPANAIFGFIDDIIRNNIAKSDNNISITIHHFTNFGATPEIDMYHLPAKVFYFYAYCKKLNYKNDWNTFVRSHYYNSKLKGVIYNPETQNLELQKKSKLEEIRPEEYKIWNNAVYTKLLNGQSILPNFLRWSNRGNKIHYDIVVLYQQIVRNMKNETIRKIKELSEFIVRDKNEHEIQKRIKKLNGTKNSSLLRRFLINEVVVKNHNEGNEKPIITVNEYVNYLFPDGFAWQEIRDMLIIAVYQHLHTLQINVEIDITDEIED